MTTADYVVAVPSYHREATLNEATLPLLASRGVDPRRVFVFVADEAERARYAAALDPALYCELVTARPTLRAARNIIARTWPAGTRILHVDDDLRDVIQATSPTRTEPVKDIDRLVRQMFSLAGRLRLGLWGLYAVPNPYFMRPTITTDLRYINGTMYGTVSNPASDHTLVTLEDKEDFERTLRFYQYDGGVLRRNDVAMVTKFYTEPGGMQDTRTDERIAWSAAELVRRYPTLCKPNTRKRSGRPEVTLRDSTRGRVPAMSVWALDQEAIG